MALFHQLPSRNDPKDKEWEKLNRAAEERAKSAPTASMPSLSHLTYKDYDEVYEPAEDTFLFLDTLQYEFEKGGFFRDATISNGVERNFVVLEIGCGSGAISVFFRRQWKSRPELMEKMELQSFVTDVNKRALDVALQTEEENSGAGQNDGVEEENSQKKLSSMEAINCDLATPLLSRLESSVDVLLFNPPYVPTDDEEVGCLDISAAWAGGADGRRVIDRAVPQISQLLRPQTGTAYLVTVDDNRPAQLAHLFQQQQQHNSSRDSKQQLFMEPLFRRRARNEYLTIQKIFWG